MTRQATIRRSHPSHSYRRQFPRGLMLLACLLLGSLAPTAALAHVKWFTDPTAYPLRMDLVVSDRTALWLISSALTVAGLTLIQRRVGRSDWPALPLLQRMAVGGPTIVAVQAAIGLTAAAAQSRLLVPNLELPSGPPGLALAAVEVVIAFTFVTGIADWLGALALIGLVPLALMVAQPIDVLEQLLWVGIGVVVLVIGRSSAAAERARPWFFRRDRMWANRAVACLRVSTGVALIAVALGEKLWNPELGNAFMSSHGMFNVFRAVFGVDAVTDDVFVLLIGLAEAAIGAALVSGRLTRLVVLGMWLPFHLGIPLLPDQELIGHLPVFGVMYLLLVHDARTSLVDALRPGSARLAPGTPVYPSSTAGLFGAPGGAKVRKLGASRRMRYRRPAAIPR